jgi:uncharacterized protein with PIN domain
MFICGIRIGTRRYVMPHVLFRFYAELNDHLPKERRQVQFTESVPDGATLGKAIESLGVPTNEIDLLLVHGASVGLLHHVKEGDRVSVYPSFDSIDVAPITEIENRPPRRLQFVLDVHLGKLAHHLRMLGYDTIYRNDYTATHLLDIAKREDRILLSKCRKLIEDNEITAGYSVRSSDPREQLIEILERFDLWRSVHPFQRCLHCNTVLRSVAKGDILDRLPLKIQDLFLDFTQCPSCERFYWEGTHFERMKKFIEAVFAERGQASCIVPKPP